MNTSRLRSRLLHHGLFVAGGAPRPTGIYWMRLFQRDTRHVAVITEVPGNPGPSITNATSSLIVQLEAQFAVDRRRVAFYEVWPSGSPLGPTPHITRVTFRNDPRWIDSSWVAIRRAAGTPIPPLPSHVELYRHVLEHGGGVFVERTRQIFEAIPPERVPPPHNPARCPHGARMTAMAEDLYGAKGWNERDQRRAGRAYLRTITPADIAKCPYHAADWGAIVEQAVNIIKRLGRQDEDAYVRAANSTPLPKTEREWLVSLFGDPVRIHPRGFTNGQHRACAMRFSGAELVVVVRRDQRLGTVCMDWTYEGGG